MYLPQKYLVKTAEGINIVKTISAVLRGKGRVSLEEFIVPDVVQTDETLIEVGICAVCGGDIEAYRTGRFLDLVPSALGHEYMGTVLAVGDNARKMYKIKEDDRVTYEPFPKCTYPYLCKYCAKGQYQHCIFPHWGLKAGWRQMFDISVPPHIFSGFGRHVLIRRGHKIHKISEDTPDKAACLSSVIGNGVHHALDSGKARVGETVVVLGVGGQGLSCVLAANEVGASPIIATGLSSDKNRFELAKEFGADYIINVEKKNIKEKVTEITDGDMADLVIDCTPSTQAFYNALEIAKFRGRIVPVGIKRELIPINMPEITMSELAIIGSKGQAGAVELAMNIIESRKYPLEKMVTHVFPLSQINEALRFGLDHPEKYVKIGVIPD